MHSNHSRVLFAFLELINHMEISICVVCEPIMLTLLTAWSHSDAMEKDSNKSSRNMDTI